MIIILSHSFVINLAAPGIRIQVSHFEFTILTLMPALLTVKSKSRQQITQTHKRIKITATIKIAKNKKIHKILGEKNQKKRKERKNETFQKGNF